MKANLNPVTMSDIYTVRVNKKGNPLFNRHALPKLHRNDAKATKPVVKVKGTVCEPHKDSTYWNDIYWS